MKTSIIILTHNQLSLTKQCLDSIMKHTDPDKMELILVDNASTDGTVEYLNQLSFAKVILNTNNVGFAKGCNQGYQIATGDLILFLNNDTYVTENWLDSMIEHLYEDEAIGLVGPVSNYVSGQQQIPVPYTDIGGIEDFASQYGKEHKGKSKRVLRLVGFCLLVKREVIETIGGFDERFGIGSFEDDDFCLRAALNGYRLLIALDSFVHHHGHATFLDDNDINFNGVYLENHRKFVDKWGIDLSYFTHPRPEIVLLVPLEAEKILDVGCGAGATGLELLNRQTCQLFGIEINSTVAPIAKSNYEVVNIQDIEEADINYLHSYFDVIILADVLEHLKDPWKVVEKLALYLKPNGSIICSIPNILHAEAVFPLLSGDWNYTNAGILDRTHIRFFTPNTVKSLFPSHLFEIQSETNKYIQVDSKVQVFFNEISYLASKFGFSMNSLPHDINVYQILIHAKKL